MDFHFRATRGNGEQVSSRISAYDFAEAQSTLKARGFRDIELTQIGSSSRRDQDSSSRVAEPSRSLPGLIVVIMIIVVILGGIAVVGEMNSKAGDGDTREKLASAQVDPEPTRPTRNSIPIAPERPVEPERRETPTPPAAPVQPVFNPDLVRGVLLEVVVVDLDLTEGPKFTYLNGVIGQATSVSIRGGTEIGYEYDVVVSFQSAFEYSNGQLESIEGHLTFHVSSDYRLFHQFSRVNEETEYVWVPDEAYDIFPSEVFGIVAAALQEIKKRQ